MKAPEIGTGKAFCKALMEAMPDEASRRALGQLLAQYAGTSIYIPATQGRTDQDARRAAARQMQAAKMPPAKIAEAIRRRYQVSARTAWRDVTSI